jgi:hypothetical protein
MDVYCTGTARVRHRETGQIVEIESDELDWDMIGSDERQMGAEFHYEAAIEHSDLGKITWGLWEYPVGIENSRETNVGPHDVIEDFDYGLEHTKDDNDEWLDPVPPDEPFTIYLNSFRESTDLLKQSGSDHGGHLVNRLVFSHQVTALEAYLGDTLAKEVFRDRNAMQRLVDQDSDLKKEKFTLTEISKDPLLVDRKVREHLRGVIYHNLAKVDVLYGIALGFRILDLTADKEALFAAVMLRHDCVHRNGSDRDGQALEVFNKTFVRATADSIRNFVQSIEQAVRASSGPHNSSSLPDYRGTSR